MKKFFAILGILILLFAGYIWLTYFRGGRKAPKGPKPVPMAVSKHSELFNKSVQSLLNAYYNMSEGFVNWDTAVVNNYAAELKTSLDSLKIDELKVDSVDIYQSALDPLANSRGNVNTILSSAAINEKRTAFNNLSENLRQLFIVVRYDREKIYWQECPMAFGDDQPANWLSRTDEVRNPYLGTKHPEYKDGMLSCGGPKDTLNFMVADTAR